MTTRTRSGIATAGLLVAALLGTACDLNFDYKRELDGAPPPQDKPAEEVRMCEAAVPEATPAYEAMCRHYCDALEETLTLAGHNTEAPGAVSRSCYELRCVPRCVSHEVCASQCHALGVQYQSACPDAVIAPDTACPEPLTEHIAACLAGCDVPVSPPDSTTTPPEDPPPDVVR